MTNQGVAGFPGAVSADTPIVPPAATLAFGSSESAWYTANRMTLIRFSSQRRTRLGGVVLDCGAASGNIEVAVYSATRNGVNSFGLLKVGGSGVIPCPTPATAPMSTNSIWVPFASFPTIDPGQFALGLWVDNTTATFAHTIANAVQRSGQSLSDVAASTVGAAAAIPVATYGGRTFACVIETA